MSHLQLPETSTWLLQARDFLLEARRLKPGPARDELREVARELRELAKLDARTAAAHSFEPQERPGQLR